MVVARILGLRELLGEFGVKCKEPMMLNVDNQVALKQLEEDGTTAKSNHVDVRIKFGAYMQRMEY